MDRTWDGLRVSPIESVTLSDGEDRRMRTVRADTHGLAATDTRLAARPERIVRRGS